VTAVSLITRHKAVLGTAPRVGLFGLLGSGNLGNDGSLEAILMYLRVQHPDAVLDFLCAGPDEVRTRYGAHATSLHWYNSDRQSASSLVAIPLKSIGKVIDAFRTAWWVRKQDIVMVPGMGVLEATLPLRPWGFPYSLLLLCASGRLFGTKVALVSVGANVMRQRATRYLFAAAARLAHYRSYRDSSSRDAMQRMGLDTSKDEVYPDLAFSLPTPSKNLQDLSTVGVGVMAYFGGNDDRRRADEIHATYVEKMKHFSRWLVDNGFRIRLFTGDRADESVVQEIVSDLRINRPDVDSSRVSFQPVSSLEELMCQMTSVHTVVATRYHNVLCALKLSKPTISIGYAAKNDELMAERGMAEFCQPIQSLDVTRLIGQLTFINSKRQHVTRTIAEQNLVAVRRLEHQFAALSTALFPTPQTPSVAAEQAWSREVPQ
jgi:polysaccharide pyruvyl transferase WcaK-like protein